MPQLYALTVYVYLCLYDEYNINIKHLLIVKLFFPDTAEIGAPDTVSHIMLRFMFTVHHFTSYIYYLTSHPLFKDWAIFLTKCEHG